MRVQLTGIGNETRNLPTTRGVLENIRAIKTKVFRQRLGNQLCLAINDILRPHSRMAIDVFFVSYSKMAREVGQSLLERINIVDIFLVATKHGNDIVEHLRIHVAEKIRVELTQLVKGVELMNDAIPIWTEHHIELLYVINVDFLPQLVGRIGKIVFLFEDTHERPGENSVEVDVAKHDVRITPANRHRLYAIARSWLNTPFLRFSLSLVYIGLKRVFGKVIVRGTDERITQLVTNLHE